MKVLVNYASASFRASQRLNSSTGLAVGRFDKVVSLGPSCIDSDFARSHREILRQRKGAGLWLWKPYVVAQVLGSLRDGDFLFYCDAGATFMDSIDPLIDLSIRHDQDLVPFELPLLESEWTKRDAFIALQCDSERYAQTKQRLASFFLVRKTDAMCRFVAEYLHFATDVRAISDQDNAFGLPNYPGFCEHRHDQSIFSLLSKRYGYEAFRDPSQWGNSLRHEYPSSNYGQLIDHTRKRTHSLVGTLLDRLERPGAQRQPQISAAPPRDRANSG